MERYKKMYKELLFTHSTEHSAHVFDTEEGLIDHHQAMKEFREKKDKKSDLLPCPFCNRECLSVEHSIGMYQVSCNLCGASGPLRDSKSDAQQVWNERK